MNVIFIRPLIANRFSQFIVNNRNVLNIDEVSVRYDAAYVHPLLASWIV